jgi:hypothetical protein
MKKVPNISKATRSYEEWLGRHMPLLQDDLDYKHKKMAESAFMFLRATYYRWIQLWDAACGNLQASPNVLAVGDIHFENFGTWRDCDGRLIWGINDFDEAAILPAALDIVRLAVSINLAVIEKSVALDPSVMIDALINGYEQYWKKFEGLAPAHASVFKPARRALALAMPAKSLDINYLRRTAGLGSLGRPRVVAIAKWGDSFVCREAKRVAPPASYWARGREKQKQINVMTIVRKQERIPDPYYHVRGKWTVRRLSPHCGKIELSSFSKEKTLLKLVAAMGAAIANIHAGSIERKILAADIRSRSKQIRKAVTKMTALTLNDWDAWKKTQRKSEKKRLKKEKSKA